MKSTLPVIALLLGLLPVTASYGSPDIAADRFATLALACVHQEYPNHISHSMQSDADVAPPRELTPAFYGCLDWHSSVHGHWLLARLARQYPESEYAQPARDALGPYRGGKLADDAAQRRADGSFVRHAPTSSR